MRATVIACGLVVAMLGVGTSPALAQQTKSTSGWLPSGGVIVYRVKDSPSTFAGYVGSIEYGARNGFGFIMLLSSSASRDYYDSWMANLDVGPSFGKAWGSTRLIGHAGASALIGGDNDGGGGALIATHVGAGAWLQPVPRVVIRPGIQIRFSYVGYSYGSASLTLGVLL